ncbi:MAG: leucyl/phenylalanyl-tRNA--protein transferase [Gammaproteobacteria bacterium]
MTTNLRPALIAPGARTEFPPDTSALAEPNGLIAVGGDLEPERLIAAYRRGIFPWYEAGQPILWWTPEPRCVLDPRALHISHSLRRLLKRGNFAVGFDTAFETVIGACAEPRKTGAGTWITPEMMQAYTTLHGHGFAHSVEVRRHGRLIGGLYGVAIGGAFFGESMFSLETDASKIALATLCAKYATTPDALVDCQVASEHLLSIGAKMIPRAEFTGRLSVATSIRGPW